MNEPKPQTPLTDAALKHAQLPDVDLALCLLHHTRSLELKLQEAEAKTSLEGYRALGKQVADALDQRDEAVRLECERNETANVFMNQVKKLQAQLQEAERQRDDAIRSENNVRQILTLADEERDAVTAERDQLIKVVDELAHGIEAFRDFGFAKHGTHYNVMMKCYESYSLLPHVQAKKGKQDK